jgi:hypothetical protein
MSSDDENLEPAEPYLEWISREIMRSDPRLIEYHICNLQDDISV